MTSDDAKPVYFVTGNQTKHQEVRDLLSGLHIVTRKLSLARVGESVEEIARNRAIQAFE
jgi:inosine/xanthosine triphosphate pyrophosphatase family protein